MEKMLNGVVVALTEAEEAARNTEIAASVADEAANGYKRKRANEYPAWQDQLDDIFHNGIDSWKATIQVTKDKYPK